MWQTLTGWFTTLDPTTQRVILASAGLVALTVTWRLLSAVGRARADRARRAELRRTMGYVQEQREELERAAERILATSSSRGLTGYVVVRQLEAVVTDNHSSPVQAMLVLKAEAARLGANALINVVASRQPSGKCAAQGDAVVVKPVGQPRAPGG